MDDVQCYYDSHEVHYCTSYMISLSFYKSVPASDLEYTATLQQTLAIMRIEFRSY